MPLLHVDSNGWTTNDYTALVQMAQDQGAPADWFAAVMMAESSMNPSAKNPAGYRGLIQFSKDNLRSLGLSNAEIENFTKRTPAQQMPFVARYFLPKRPPGGWINRSQLYQATYLPATIRSKGSAPGAVLARRGDGTGFYEGNTIFDFDKKGFITVGDLEHRLQNVTSNRSVKWADALNGIQAVSGQPTDDHFVVFNPETAAVPRISRGTVMATILGGLVLGASGYYIYKMQQQQSRQGSKYRAVYV